jgi:hypothetical protein
LDTPRVAKLIVHVVVQYSIWFGHCCPTDESLDSSRVASLNKHMDASGSVQCFLEARALMHRMLQSLNKHNAVSGSVW